MSNKKITAKEYARINGLNTGMVQFVISKKYSDAADTRTAKQWENEFVKNRLQDPIKEQPQPDQKNEGTDGDSQE